MAAFLKEEELASESELEAILREVNAEVDAAAEEAKKAPKPMPACATPVVEGMKVFTKSPRAISAQKATLEFLLITHPLDCPI